MEGENYSVLHWFQCFFVDIRSVTINKNKIAEGPGRCDCCCAVRISRLLCVKNDHRTYCVEVLLCMSYDMRTVTIHEGICMWFDIHRDPSKWVGTEEILRTYELHVWSRTIEDLASFAQQIATSRMSTWDSQFWPNWLHSQGGSEEYQNKVPDVGFTGSVFGSNRSYQNKGSRGPVQVVHGLFCQPWGRRES